MTAKATERQMARRTRIEEHALTLKRFRELVAAWMVTEAELRGGLDALRDRVAALEAEAARPWWRKAWRWLWRRTGVLPVVALLVLPLLPRVAEAQRVDERWKRVAHDGFDAPVWVHHVVNASASATGYGALRLAGMTPAPAAATVVGVGVAAHVRGWLMGDYRPSLDWAFDAVTRGGPALALAVCETKGRRACALAVGALLGAYLVTLPAASP